MVERLETWPWSSYLATCGQAAAPEWLQTDWVLAQFGRQRASAIRKYVQFVHKGARLPSVWTRLQGQIFLGSEAFVKAMQAQMEKRPSLDEIPRAQRRGLTQPLADFRAALHAQRSDGASVPVGPAHDGGNRRALRRALFDGKPNGEKS